MQPIDYIITVIYLLCLVTIGLLLQKRASSDIDSYFLGNRKIPWWALGASGMASNMDVAGTMINTAFIFALGVSGFFIEIRGGVCLILAFLIVFMGKWNRRSKVMTQAEWMHFRFGKKREGDVARLLSAISMIVVTIAMITYFAVGAGKFIGTVLGLPDLGNITDPLIESEVQQIDYRMNSITEANQILVDKTGDFEKFSSESKAITHSINKSIEKWNIVKENKNKISPVRDLEQQISAVSNQIRAFERSIGKTENEISPENFSPLKSQVLGIEQKIDDLQQSLDAAVSYKIIITRSFLASTLMILLAMIYTVASGLYGVVWTDVFQGILIFGTIIMVCYLAFTKSIPDVFNISIPMRDGTFMAVETTREAWTNVVPPWKMNLAAESSYSIYNLFGIAIIFYLIKVTIEGSGGPQGYMLQRYFAASSDREAGLLAVFWTFLLSFRWPFITAVAILGIYMGTQQGVIGDPESVLPVVIGQSIPTGLKGLLVAGLMAAAMSTFDSTVNAGAAYWTKDIYQTYLKPKATHKQLMFHSRMASIVIVLFGLFFSLAIKNINEIWGWITMSIGAGLFVPLLVRWYWWRMNGYGFAWGTAVGMISAVLQKLILPDVPEYVSFSITSGASLIAMIIATLATKPTDKAVLENFYLQTRPFGLWKPIREKISASLMTEVNRENRRDIIALFFAVPWQLVLFIMWMALMMKRWDEFSWLIVALIGLSIGLYYFWYRHLSTEVDVESFQGQSE